MTNCTRKTEKINEGDSKVLLMNEKNGMRGIKHKYSKKYFYSTTYFRAETKTFQTHKRKKYEHFKSW